MKPVWLPPNPDLHFSRADRLEECRAVSQPLLHTCAGVLRPWTQSKHANTGEKNVLKEGMKIASIFLSELSQWHNDRACLAGERPPTRGEGMHILPATYKNSRLRSRKSEDADQIQ